MLDVNYRLQVLLMSEGYVSIVHDVLISCLEKFMTIMKTRPEWYYKQSAVIPYRKLNGIIEILLITSRRKKKWIIPKGIIELGLSTQASAAKEAEEEAGVAGVVSEKIVGTYKYDKWGGICNVEVYSLAVTKVLEKWEEDDFRERKWFTLEKAVEKVGKKELSLILNDFRKVEI